MAITDDFPEIFDSTKIPSTLYHYTSVPGLYGIIDKSAIWANDFRFLNDGSEIVHLFENLPGSENVVHYLRDATDRLVGHPNYVIVSFSEAPDDLAMWGRYSKDEGLCLGFSKETIENLIVKEDRFQTPVIGKCVYVQSEKDRIISQITSRFDPENAGMMLNALIFIAPFLKNESFRNEREWRVVFKYRSDAREGYGRPEFRPTQNSIIPFMNASVFYKEEMDCKIRTIEEVILSPRLSRMPNAEMMIRNYLQCRNVELKTLRKSVSSLV